MYILCKIDSSACDVSKYEEKTQDFRQIHCFKTSFRMLRALHGHAYKYILLVDVTMECT